MKTHSNQQNATIGETAKGAVVPVAAMLAFLSASCCVLPIGLSILGLGGSWLTLLGPFVVYREVILLGVAIVLGWAWYRMIWPSNSMKSKRTAVLWVCVGTAAFAIAATSPWWEPTASKFMWELFRTTL